MRRFFVCLITVAVLVSISISGCATSEGTENLLNNAKIGIIETQGTEEASRIVFYDADLEKITELPLQLATLGGIFYDPLVYKNNLFAIPQGIANRKDGKSVIKLNLQNLSLSSFAIDQIAMNTLAVNDDYIFTCNTMNGTSYITRCTMETGDVGSIQLEGVYVSNIIWAYDRLCAFSSTLDGDKSQVHCYDENLDLVQTVDTTECGQGTYKAQAYQGKIYFTNLVETKNQESVSVLDTADGTVSRIQLDGAKPFDIEFAESRLYVAHYDIVERTNESSLSIIDLELDSTTKHEFDHGAEQIVVTDQSLYVLSDRTLYRYDANDLHLICSTRIDEMGTNYSYLSGLFAID